MILQWSVLLTNFISELAWVTSSNIIWCLAGHMQLATVKSWMKTIQLLSLLYNMYGWYSLCTQLNSQYIYSGIKENNS